MFKQTSTNAFHRLGWIAVLAIAAAVAAGISYAAVPSADGTISACTDAKGVLKVIDVENGATCVGGKKPLTWNQQGPQGLSGAPGPKGDTGAQGLTGASGATGPKGDTGSQGLAGPKGDTGPQGLPGVSGYEQVNAGSAFNSNSPKELVVTCPDGKQPLGGGAYLSLYNGLTPAGTALTRSYPVGNEWVIDAAEIAPTADSWSIVGNVACGVVE